MLENKNKSLYYMVKKYIIQRNNNKQKQNINIKIHVGDKGKKKNKKYKSRKLAEKEGISSFNYAARVGTVPLTAYSALRTLLLRLLMFIT